VVASFGDGQKLTVEQLQKFAAVLPPEMRQMAMRDRKNFVQQYALMHRLAELAIEAKLDQKSPVKEQLEFNRTYVLMNAELNDTLTNIIVPAADQQRFYDANQDRFTQVKVKVIYVSFAANPSASSGAKKYLSEPEAKAKIEKLRQEITAGADFVSLVKVNSDDATSAAKDGDFGTIRRTDKIPEAIRNTVFALQPGQVSEPVRQPNGYYLFRAEEITARPFSEVQEEIQNELRQARFKQWMDQTTRGLNVKLESEAYFK
jgi:parvulin-like peptidyl-prolyl isomerase